MNRTEKKRKESYSNGRRRKDNVVGGKREELKRRELKVDNAKIKMEKSWTK